MDFGLTDEQEMLRKAARDFVTKVCPPERAKDWDERQVLPTELLRGYADMGWFAMPFPEEDGGDGGSAIELVIIAEELGRASFDVAMSFIGVLIPALTVFRWASPEQKRWIREEIMTGRHRLAVAMSEPETGSDAAALRTSAADQGDHYLVNGHKMWCTGGSQPDTTIAMYVRTESSERKHDGLSLVLLDPTTEGVSIRRMPTLARHLLGTTELTLVDVKVPKDRLVGPENKGWGVMLSNLELERVLLSGGYIGAAQATLDEMLSFAKTREAFGRPIGEFQSLAHAMADLQVDIDAARLLTHRAAWLLANGRPCSREGAMAKLKGSETYVAAARLGMQVMAAHGFSTESVMSFRYRESIVTTISGGTSQIQRNGIARSMGLRAY